MLTTARPLSTALFAALALMFSVAHPGVAGSDAGGDVTFRLTLRGDVAPGDSFSLAVDADDPTVISPGVRCGPGSEQYTPQFTACAEGSYDFVVAGQDSLPVGTRLTYVWARIAGGFPDGKETVIYTDTVTITENSQVVTVVYDYGASSLPDTAVATSDFAPGTGVAAVIVALAALGYAVRGRRREVSAP